MYLGYVFIYIAGVFYESLSSFHDIETNCGVAMKATPLINSSRMAFYLLAFDVRHLCKGLRSNAITGPFIAGAPPSDCLLVLEGGHPSENIDCWTVSACVCIRRAALERNCKCLCVVCVVAVCLRVLMEK